MDATDSAGFHGLYRTGCTPLDPPYNPETPRSNWDARATRCRAAPNQEPNEPGGSGPRGADLGRHSKIRELLRGRNIIRGLETAAMVSLVR